MSLPFDLQDLEAFLLVAELGSFAQAASRSHVSPSALTRQIQRLEKDLGQTLIVRTTRSLRLTEAGHYWRNRGRHLINRAEAIWEEHQERFENQPHKVRVGVCRTIAMAYLPGFFHAYRKAHPECHVHLWQGKEEDLEGGLDRVELDVAILSQPRDSFPGIEEVYHFEDGFVAIGPEDASRSPSIGVKRLADLPLIALDRKTRTGAAVQTYLEKSGGTLSPVMEMDNYDLIINSVALGLGYAIVPNRALAIYRRNRRFSQFQLEEPFARTLAVLVRSDPRRPAHLTQFINSILF